MIQQPANFEEFTDEQLEAQITLVQDKLAGRRLDLYNPHPKQMLFHSLGGDQTITDRLLMAGNQCFAHLTSLDLPRGRERRFDEMLGEEAFDVRSWDGVSRCTAQASRVFLRGIEPTFRLLMGNGQSFACSGRHQVLTTSGWLSLDQLVRLSSGWRCQKTTQDCPASYGEDGRRNDARLHVNSGNDQSPLPSASGALERRRRNWREDEAEPTLQYTHAYREIVLPTTPDDPAQLAVLFAQFPDPTSQLDAQWPKSRIRDVRQFLIASALHSAGRSSRRQGAALVATLSAHQQSCDVEERLARSASLGRALGLSLSEFSLGQGDLESLGTDSRTVIVVASSPPLVGGVEILAIQPIGIYPICDITVKKTHTYLNSGVISHNCGKTMAAGAELAMHLCGRYPSWWKGKRFPQSVRMWVGSPTSQTTRDAAQRILMGPVGEWGTGMIPARDIIDWSKAPHGVPNAMESIRVRHLTGGISSLQYKSYDQGRERWQGDTLDGVWFDEEPPLEIWSEGRTRTNVPGNFTMMTFTPLQGMSDVVRRFLTEKPAGSIVIPMGIEDALHYTPEARRAVIAGYPEHEKKARAYGIPVLGSGAVFPIDEEKITCQAFQIPSHWPRICGMDIGWDHPTACAWIAWDRDTDTIYVYDSHRVKEQTPVFHAATIKAKGVWIPVAWPHDGLQHDKGSGAVIANQYRELGINMLKEKATHKPEKGKKEGTGGYGIEAGIQEMLTRMQTGRFKVFSHLGDWFEEYRGYHRKDGLIVKEHDDLMSATRVGLMMLRFAKIKRPDSTQQFTQAPFVPSYGSTGVLG